MHGGLEVSEQQVGVVELGRWWWCSLLLIVWTRCWWWHVLSLLFRDPNKTRTLLVNLPSGEQTSLDKTDSMCVDLFPTCSQFPTPQPFPCHPLLQVGGMNTPVEGTGFCSPNSEWAVILRLFPFLPKQTFRWLCWWTPEQVETWVSQTVWDVPQTCLWPSNIQFPYPHYTCWLVSQVVLILFKKNF